MTTWPDTLPAAPLLENFQELLPETAIRTDMDTGPAKIRQRTTAAVGSLMASYLLSTAETITLDAFYETTLFGGSGSFDYTHPRTGATLSCRFVSPPEYTPVNGNYFKVTLTLEIFAMSRILSSPAQQSIYAPETGDAFIVLLTISNAALAEPICVTSDEVTTVSNGVSFVPFPFDLVLPNDMDSKSYRAKLVIDNIDRSIVQAVRDLTTAPSVLIQIVRAATPDVIEAQFVDFNLTNVTYDAYRVQGDLTVEDFTAEPFPSAIFSPGLFPGLF